MDASLLIVLAVCAALVLARYRLQVFFTVACDEAEQWAQSGDLTSQVVAPSQATLQVKDDQVGIVAGTALAAHVSEITSGIPSVPREFAGKNSGEGRHV